MERVHFASTTNDNMELTPLTLYDLLMVSEIVVQGSAPRAVITELADGRRLTAADISLGTGLPRTTVLHALNRLARAGAIEEHPAGPAVRGRPARRWSIVQRPGPLGVVVAAAHGTVVGVVDAEGTVHASRELPALEVAPKGRHASAALAALDEVLTEVADVVPADARSGVPELSMAVVGLPGPSGFALDTGSAADASSSGHLRRFRTWDERSPVDVLAERLGCPVYTENDANLAALGEAVLGVGAGLDTVLHVCLAHGTGSGLVLHGRLHRGHSRLAGEIGHLHADDEGRLCHCGARGCFWHTRSVPALLDALAEAHGRPFTQADVAGAAADDDHDVVRALLGFGHALGRRLADAIVFVDPDAVVIDGSLGAASEVIAEGVREAVRRYAPPTMARATQVLVGRWGAAAPLVGAAALARSEGLFGRRA